tara:strand:+ start:131 stop:811 length:681 start_codon:yes stop_codon:yes gene_type:complete
MLMNYTRRNKGKINLIIDNPRNNTKPYSGPVIHTFGDSHALFGWGNDIKKNNINSSLCYTFGKKKLDRIDIRKFNVKTNDTIIFCLGEIDCRCHVYKHITTDNTYQMIIDEIISDYIEAIQLNVKVFNNKLKNVCIYNVPPTIRKKIEHSPDNPFPLLGTDEERKQYILYFNKILEQKCKENKILFFDIYNHYVDEEGFLRTELSDGGIHIKNGVYIQKFIDEHLL